MTQTNCPDSKALIDLASGLLSPGETPAVRAHLADCPTCCVALGQIDRAWTECRSKAASGPRRIRRWTRPAIAVAAAAGFLAIGSGWIEGVRENGSRSSAERGDFLRIKGVGETIATGPGETLRLALPDGSMLEVAPGTSARFRPPTDSERSHLELQEGAVALEVTKARGTFRISTPAGDVEVLGTRFRLQAFTLHPPVSAAAHCLSVEVSEGRVAVGNLLGQAVVQGGQRCIALPGFPPRQHGSPAGRADLLEGFARLIERREGFPRVRPGAEDEALALAALYWSVHGVSATSELMPPDLQEIERLLRRWKDGSR